MKRRKFLAIAGATALGGCSESDPSGGGVSRPEEQDRQSEVMHQATQLQDILENDRVIDFSNKMIFVGNPNHYDQGLSSINLSDREGHEVIASRYENGWTAEEIWIDYLDSVGSTEEEALDQNMIDPLDYDVIEEGELNMLFLDATDISYLENSAVHAKNSMEDITGLEINMAVEDGHERTRDEIIQLAKNYPDTMVYHVSAEEGMDYGISESDLNLAIIRAGSIGENSSDPELALSKVFEHEGYHSIAGMPHILHPEENMMSVKTADPANAELKPQSKDMIESYLDSQIGYEVFIEDGKGYLEVGFEPFRNILDGQEYLEQNTYEVLDRLDFPVEDWNMEVQRDSVWLSRDDVDIMLQPGERSGYEDVRIHR